MRSVRNLGLRGSRRDVDSDADRAGRTQVRLVNLQIAETVLKFVPAVVMKSKLPSSKRRPWNVTVWAIRFKAFSD